MVEDAGIGVNSVSSAGTSTLREAVADPVVTEVQAGTYALMEPDTGSSICPSARRSGSRQWS